jgi:hypothetical protein
MAWVAAGAGLVVLGLVGYGITIDRNCSDLSDVVRGSFRFRLCHMANESIGAVPVTEPMGAVSYSRRYHDGLKPGVSDVKYASRRSPEEVRVVLEKFLTSKGFALARRETDFDWWSDQRTEMGISVRAAAGAGCLVEVMHVTWLD